MSEDKGRDNGENENGGRRLEKAAGGLDQTPTELDSANGEEGSSSGSTTGRSKGESSGSNESSSKGEGSD